MFKSRIIKTFDNLDAFKEYLEGDGRKELLTRTVDEILSTLTDESDGNFKEADSFNCTEKLRGYEAKDVELVEDENGWWKYYVRFTNEIGGNMRLKVYLERGMDNWEATWKDGVIKLEMENVSDLYDLVTGLYSDFFRELDAHPETLIRELGERYDRRTKKVTLEMQVDTCDWTLTLKYANNRTSVVERP